VAIAWHDKKESVSLVWEISLRNVVIGKYSPAGLELERFRIHAGYVAVELHLDVSLNS
jgi:hypothetical protein